MKTATPNPLTLAIQAAAFGLCLSSLPVLAEDDTFALGNVVVNAPNNAGEQVVDQAQLNDFNQSNVSAVLNSQAGVFISKNSRNEDTISIRGFDSRQVPLFLDGIPQYVPYDGYVDFGRFTTFDLSEVRVAKGAASLLYGPNIMGGAINLVTRKPTQAFEGDVRLGVASGDERTLAVNIGSNQGAWYVQAGASYLDADNFPLSKDFRDKKTKPTDNDKRENAYRTDKKGSFKIGYTPNATDEYVLGYSKQEGEKGNPVYTGDTDKGIRYWQWPYWNKDSLYFISSTDFARDYTLKTRLYRDTYENLLEAFTDGSYSTQMNNGNFPSVYEDKTFGAAIELISRAFNRHELHLAAHYKDDRHVDKNPNSETKEYQDATYSIALEDHIQLADAWRLRVGASHEERQAKEVYQWPTGKTTATNGLAELTYQFSEKVETFASVAHKTRVPTIKDRYSARMGSALPNPDLKPETALHTEIGLRGTPWAGATGEISVFYSDINDAIQTAIVNSSECGSTTCNQAQNVGHARHTGLDLNLQQELGEQWQMGVAYSYLDRDNLSDRQVLLTDTPEHKLFGQLSYSPTTYLRWQTSLSAESGRQVSYAGQNSDYKEINRFALLNSQIGWQVQKNIRLEAGVNNITDKNYELSDGFPMPGRVFFANTQLKF